MIITTMFLKSEIEKRRASMIVSLSEEVLHFSSFYFYAVVISIP